MQFTTVRSKEKDYDIYLKSEKLVHSQQEHENIFSQLFGSGKNVPSYFEPGKTLLQPCYLETKKCSSQQLVKEKYHDIYLKSEKLVHSNQKHEKNVFQVFGSGSQLFRA